MRCSPPIQPGAFPSGSFPYIHSADVSCTSANSSDAVASQTFIVIVSLNPSVIERSLAGSWTFP